MISRSFLFFFFLFKLDDICTDCARAVVARTSGASAGIKAAAPSCPSSHYIISPQCICIAGNKMPLSPKNALVVIVKMIRFAKFQPLNIPFFSMIKALCCIQTFSGCFEEKHLYD